MIAEDIKYLYGQLVFHQNKTNEVNLFAGGNFGVVAVKYLEELWKK